MKQRKQNIPWHSPRLHLFNRTE